MNNEEQLNTNLYRVEEDGLGRMRIPAEALYGIHALRARQNFPVAGRPVHPGLIAAYGTVKAACAETNRELGAWAETPAKAEAILRACEEVAAGLLNGHIVVDALQGGAGTSTNMNVNEVITNRALQLLGMVAVIHLRLRGFHAERYFVGVRNQVRYGMVLGVAGTLWSMVARLHDFFVSRYYGTEAYAVYSAGCTEIPIAQVFTQAVAVVALGQFALLEQNQDWAGIRRLWHRVLTSSYAILLPTTILLVAVARPLVVFMFTATYAGAVPIFQINTL
ncbi:MAG TPA: lyase family protein, partial [Candidatus Hydrogenedentes bacterium]|nr:lyase family protein [Candidatus Hydrogenedentota bacterium]